MKTRATQELDQGKTVPTGLHLRLQRDLSPKFRNDASKAGNSPRPEFDWHVLGPYDSLSIVPIDRLEDLDRLTRGALQSALGAEAELCAFPFDSDNLTPCLTRLGIQAMGGDKSAASGEKPPFLILCAFSLAPSFFDYSRKPTQGDPVSPKRTVEIIRRTSKTMAELIDHELAESTLILRALGAADLVVIAGLKSEDQVCRFLACYSKMRSLTLAEAVNDAFEGEPHAFGATEAYLAISDTLIKKPQDFESIYSGDPSSQVYSEIRIRCECGHEFDVIKKLAPYCEAKTLRRSAGRYQVTGGIPSLESLVNLFRRRLLEDSWTEPNLVDSECYPVINDSADAPISGRSDGDSVANQGEDTDNDTHRPVWQLSQDVNKILTSCETLLVGIKPYVSNVLYVEVTEVFRAISAAFRRHEFVAVSRDLLPFLRTFQQWIQARIVDLSSTPQGDLSKTIKEFRLILEHLHRAVRNRIDCRRPQADPQLLTTNDRGVSGLISAYSAALSISMELFSRPPVGEPVACGDGYTACVSSGTSGTIEIRRIRFDEDGAKSLQLANVAGIQMLRPVMMFAACLHEAAEVVNGQREATYFQRSVKVALVDNLIYRLHFDIIANNISLKAEEEQVREMCEVAIHLALNLQTKWEDGEETALEFSHRIKKILSASRRSDFDTASRPSFSIHRRSFYGAAPYPSEQKAVDIALNRHWRPAYEHMETSSFRNYVGLVCDLAVEIVADFGMWIAFDAIMGNGQADRRGLKERTNDCDRFFKQVVEFGFASQGGSADRNWIKTILARWVVQRGALENMGRSNEDLRNFRDEMTKKIEKGIREKWPTTAAVEVNASPGGNGGRPGIDGRPDVSSKTETWGLFSDIQWWFPYFCKLQHLPACVTEYAAFGGRGREILDDWRQVEKTRPEIVEVLDCFRDGWTRSDAMAEVDFAFLLWAKAQCFWPGRILESSKAGVADGSK